MPRPKIDFDVEQVEALGRIGCTYPEVAAVLGCSQSTVERRMVDEDSAFCGAYKKGFAEVLISLRRKQIELALEGNVTMLVWLGKQLLEQSDKAAHRLKHEREFQPKVEVILNEECDCKKAKETPNPRRPRE